MCGIAGIVAPKRKGQVSWLSDQIGAMTGALIHRGPDDGGVWLDPEAGVALGHRRLSVIDLSTAGHQPMADPSGRFVISYNGEIYNHAELRKDLANRGVSFRGRSDTEVLLHSIALSGVETTLASTNGMFAFAVWDRTTRSLTLARDRLGQKPLYYGWVGSRFVFASELKAIVGSPGFGGQVDPRSLEIFLRLGYVPDPLCIWEGLHKLMPGHSLTIGFAATEHKPSGCIRRYWSLRETARVASSAWIQDPMEAKEGLAEVLSDAVRLCLESDVPLGAFLSGGIDSSCVVGLMQQQRTQPIRTFTVGFGDRRFDEAAFAREVASRFGTEHTELHVSEEEALGLIPALPTMYDEPFADPSQIPTALIARLARQHVTVALSGDGGDELFGGYNRHRWGRRFNPESARTPRWLRRAGARGILSVPPAAWDRVAALLAPDRAGTAHFGDGLWKLAGSLRARDGEELYWSLVTTNGTRRSLPLVERARSEEQPWSPTWPGDHSTVDAMMILDGETYLPGDILTKVDRATMAVGLEARVPLLDHRVVEFAWRLPQSLRFHDGRGKWPLRAVLGDMLPAEVFDRPKMGFTVPIHTWLRGDLHDWGAERILGYRPRPDELLDFVAVRRLWVEHQSGHQNHQNLLWRILMYVSWREAWEEVLC